MPHFELVDSKGSINNWALSLIIVAVIVGGGYLTMALFSTSENGNWANVQAKTLGKKLSGQVLGAFADKPSLPASVKIPILAYSYVGPIPKELENNKLRVEKTVLPAEFEMQLAWLKGQGFNTITLNDLYRYTEGEYQLPHNPIILTFDDGYASTFDHAVPILKEYGYTGSFAIITQFDGLNYGNNQYATHSQIRAAHQQGMEIISKTQDHFDATAPHVDAAGIQRNLKGSQADIQQITGTEPPPVLVYPYGSYNERYIKEARAAGIQLALTTQSGNTVEMKELMEIPRLRILGSTDIEEFKQIILK